jgi:hypothetical protein
MMSSIQNCQVDKMTIIFDVDGTLMNIDKRLSMAIEGKRPEDKKMNWDIFLDPKIMADHDTPYPKVVNLAKSLEMLGATIVITSARNERHRDVTVSQLLNAGVPYKALYLRADDDYRHDSIIKSELLVKMKLDGFNPTLAVDDRPQVVENWLKEGIFCIKVNDTNA